MFRLRSSMFVYQNATGAVPDSARICAEFPSRALRGNPRNDDIRPPREGLARRI